MCRLTRPLTRPYIVNGATPREIKARKLLEVDTRHPLDKTKGNNISAVSLDTKPFQDPGNQGVYVKTYVRHSANSVFFLHNIRLANPNLIYPQPFTRSRPRYYKIGHLICCAGHSRLGASQHGVTAIFSPSPRLPPTFVRDETVFQNFSFTYFVIYRGPEATLVKQLRVGYWPSGQFAISSGFIKIP